MISAGVAIPSGVEIPTLTPLASAVLGSGSARAAGAPLGLSTTKQVIRRVRPVVLRCGRMRRTVTALAAGIAATTRDVRPVMVTLTYAPGSEWEPWHVSRYLQAVHSWAVRQGVTLPRVWVAELQLGRFIASGCRPAEAVHFHVLFWLPARLSMPKADKRGWWPHGMTRTERARNPVGYMAKYASKGDPGVR